MFKIVLFIFGIIKASRPLNDNQATCKQYIWPIIAGGSNHEYVNCFAYHEKQQIIIIGGNTTSSDFGPTPSPHGFLYALSLSGDFKWGRFFYNSNTPVTDITGCHVFNDTISVVGMSGGEAIVFDIEAENGRSVA
jgi:hypothetical protein